MLENQVWLKDTGKAWYSDRRGLVFALTLHHQPHWQAF
jgi:hypothetical protein